MADRFQYNDRVVVVVNETSDPIAQAHVGEEGRVRGFNRLEGKVGVELLKSGEKFELLERNLAPAP